MTELFRYADSAADRRDADPADGPLMPAHPRDRPVWPLPAEVDDPPDRPQNAEAAVAVEQARDQLRRPAPAPERLLPDELAHLQSTLPPKTQPHDTGLEHKDTPQWNPEAGVDADVDPDLIRASVDRPQAVDYANGMPPKIYADPIGESDQRPRPDQPMPLFAGLPRREQAGQGALGDCGVIAVLGAVAGHRPHDITDAAVDNHDGTYTVTLHEAKLDRGLGVSEPTGRTIELAVTRDLPVNVGRETTPAFAPTNGTAWCAIMEKAVAGSDQAWRAEQRVAWNDTWNDDILPALTADEPDGASRVLPPPTGYARLNQGNDAYERAELLTQLTGMPAEVRAIPAGSQADQPILELLETQLTDRKPVTVATRPIDPDWDGETLPHRLEEGHVYEVVEVRDGQIHLRNPWNFRHPDPLSPEQFRECFTRPLDDGSRRGFLTTLR